MNADQQFLLAIVTGILVPIITLGLVPLLVQWSLRRRTDSETREHNARSQTNLHEALEKSAGAVGELTGNLIEGLKAFQEEREELLEEIDQLRERVRVLEDGREARTRELEELRVENRKQAAEMESLHLQIEALNREYTIKVTTLQDQIEAGEKRYKDLEGKSRNYRNAIELLIGAMKQADIPLPAGVELLLGDSIDNFKWPDKKK